VNYKEALAWLYSLQRFGIKLGLENIRRLIAALNVDLAGVRVIHVAGTNGKGSVCAMIDAICRAAGYRTGLFTSPHLVTFRERIRVNGEIISEEAVASGLTNIRKLISHWDPHPTFFEVTTALALKYFSECSPQDESAVADKIDICILETGLGGRLDATNASDSDVAVITPVDLDHQKWLGDSLPQIAAEKAGIIKPKTPVVCAPQPADVGEVIRKRAAECEAPLQVVTRVYDQSPIALRGAYQNQNAAVAIAAIHAAKIDIDYGAITRGLASVEWPARFQKWDEQLVIDGAHNPAAARVLAQTWRETFSDERPTLILAILKDKDLRGICQPLAPISDFVFLPKIRSERAAAPEELRRIMESVPTFCRAGASSAGNLASLPGCPTICIAQSVAEAITKARARPAPILLTGSLHFAGEALAYLGGDPAAFEECAQ
jgi:dihydrofolate synthase / folylpolyglutamate synthase